MADKVKVLFINRSYWPDVEATGQLLTQLCEGLASDLDVTVLCGMPNHLADTGATDASLEETKKKLRFGVRNDVKIKRVRHTTFYKGSFVGRCLNFVTFCWSSFFRLLLGKKVDIVVCETDPPIAAIFAFLVTKIRGMKLVCYLQDIYPDIAVEAGKLKENFVTKVLRSWLIHVYKRSDAVVVLSQDMKRWLTKHGVVSDRIYEIHNWVDTHSVVPIKNNNEFRIKNQLQEKFVVMYSGNMGQTQDFDTLINVMKSLNDDPRVQFCFVGGGVKREWLGEQIDYHGIRNACFFPYQPLEYLATSLSAADLQLVLLAPSMTNLLMPSKLYSALATGTPVLGVGLPNSHLARILKEGEAGIFAQDGDVQVIVQHIQDLAADSGRCLRMGERARQLAVDHFDQESSIGRFRQLLVRIQEGTQMADKNSSSSQDKVHHVVEPALPNHHLFWKEQKQDAPAPPKTLR